MVLGTQLPVSEDVLKKIMDYSLTFLMHMVLMHKMK